MWENQVLNLTNITMEIPNNILEILNSIDTYSWIEEISEDIDIIKEFIIDL